MKKTTITGVGIDGGLATLGLARVDVEGTKPRVVALDFHATEKASKKVKVSVTYDDRVRARAQVERICAFIDDARYTDVIGMEWYLPNRLNRSGWKTLLVVGGVLALAHEEGWPMLIEQLPGEVKRFVGNPKADKDEVVRWCRKNVLDFDRLVDRFPATKHEHLADATIHAILATREFQRRR